MVQAAGAVTIIFYNQVLGVPAVLCGTAFFIASLVDAVSDPLVGALSDSVRTRWGRRHPFMFLSAFPLGLCFYLLYQPPEDLSSDGLFIWLTVMMIGVRIAKTFYSVPHAALGAELTDNYDERTSIFGWNWIVLFIGSVLLGAFVMIGIFPSNEAFSNGLLNEERYPILAIFGGLFCTAAVLACTFATADQIPYLHRQLDTLEAIKRNYAHALSETWVNLKALVVNPSYLSVCICWLILAVSGGVIAVVATYTFVYAFEFSTEQIALRDFVRVPGALVAVAFAAWLTHWLDKKHTVIYTIAITTFLIGLPYCLKLLGWFPANGTTALLFAFFSIWLFAFITLPVVPIVIDSQLVDVADEHELLTGNRAEGLIFSIRTFSLKMTQGIGGFIASFGLEWIDFPEQATPETVTPQMIDGLLFMMGPLYYIIVYAGLGFAFLYRIDKQRHAEILAALRARRDA